MLICWYVWKGDFKSSYNYRPKWAQVDLPEDVKTRIDKEAAKWLFFIAGAFLCAMIVGFVYGFVTGNYDDLPTIFLATAACMVRHYVCPRHLRLHLRMAHRESEECGQDLRERLIVLASNDLMGKRTHKTIDSCAIRILI